MSIHRIVYVLVSAPCDHIAEMAMVSATALRIVSPGVKSTVVADPLTLKGLTGHRAKLLELVDNIVEVAATDANPMARSRRIKTSLREHVEGDYLYMDVDAVPIKPLNPIFELDAEFAAALDGNMASSKFVFHEFERETFAKMGWAMPTGPYFNSGVLFVRDTTATRQLYTTWHDIWREVSAKGLLKDQPPLHRALSAVRLKVRQLPPQWNALIGMYTGGVRGARVMHFSTIRFEERDDTVFHRIVKNVKNTGVVDVGALRNVIATGYPWTNQSSVRLRYAVGDYQGMLAAALRRGVRMLMGKSAGPAGRSGTDY
jgi:hypothetical protein